MSVEATIGWQQLCWLKFQTLISLQEYKLRIKIFKEMQKIIDMKLHKIQGQDSSK